MKYLNYILIIFICPFFCLREKFQIINVDNPNFKEEENNNIVFGFNNMKYGACSPCYGLNNQYEDIFGQKWNGYCELTKKGFLQLFKFGKVLQKRYLKLLGIDKPNINKVRAYASQANKTLMSSNALFYGLFINKSTPIDEQITVPVRNFRKNNDSEIIPIFYYTDSSNCKGWKKIVEKNMENRSEEINKFMNDFLNRYKSVFELIEKDERIINAKNDIDKINLFCSSYISNYYDDRIPKIKMFEKLKYKDEDFFNIYYDCYEFNFNKSYYIDYGNNAEKVPAIVLNELVSELIYNMDLIIHSPQNATTKFISYIGHDSSVMAFQIILQKAFSIEPRLMNYASNQMFLLYKTNNNDENIEKNYKVKYFYNDKLLISIQYNDFKISLEKILKSGSHLEFFCESFKPVDYLILSLCSGIIILIIAIASVCCYHRNILLGKKVYIQLKEEQKVEIK